MAVVIFHYWRCYMMAKKIIYDIKSLSWTALISIVLSILSAAVIYFTNLPETLLKSLSTAVLIVSVLPGGFYAGKIYGSKGFLHGSRIGLLVFAIILVASFITKETGINSKEILLTMITCCVSGAVGGILGVGFSEKETK